MTRSQFYGPRVACRSAWHDIRGVRYHVSEWGDRAKPLLVLLHGWGDTGTSFQFLVDELQGDWFAIAPDWRGFGQSHVRAEGYWFPDYIADLDVLLQIYQPDGPARILGHSMGANVAGLYAGIMPERVAAFVNVEGFGLQDSNPGDAPAHFRHWIESSRDMPGASTYRSFDALVGRIMKRSPSMPRDRALFVAASWASEREDGSIVLNADPAHKLPNAVQYRRAEAQACWDSVTAPVLLVLGEDTDFTAAAKSWIDQDEAAHPFRGARTAVVPGAGHMVHIEQPAALAAVIEDFLGAAS